jgi:hypothetical protein
VMPDPGLADFADVTIAPLQLFVPVDQAIVLLRRSKMPPIPMAF